MWRKKLNINVVLVKMKGLLSKYQKISPLEELSNNEYANFRFAYINYYKPFQLYILKDLRDALKFNKEPLDKYKEYILDTFYELIRDTIYSIDHTDSEFIEKLSESMCNEFNQMLGHYKALNGDAKKKFMNQFVINKKKALVMILEKNPYLFLKTVANIRSPLMQFFIINKIPEVTENLPKWLNSFSKIKFYIVLIEYFFYPLNVDPKSYYSLWQGESLIHVKFAKSILSNKYEEAKKFLKMKYQFEIEYLSKK